MASRDFLGRFGREGGAPAAGGGSAATVDSDDIELSLGLSLGGCFGADPAHEAKKPRLVRSTSIPSICSLPGGFPSGEEPAAVTAPPSDLLRTSSLPTEYMEDRLRRRAMQSQRRLEAKRKRLERRNSMNSGRSGPNASAAVCRDEALEQTVPSGFQFRRTVALQGTTSSSVPEQASAGSGAEAKSPPAMNTSETSGGQSSSRPPTASGTGRPSNGTTGREQPPLRTLRSLTMRTASTGDLRNSMVEDMPMVSYKVEGPSGRKTDGFLYKYRKGEEVRIVCVCHGNFLTPAEFVRHAGGGDVTNPLRHIVVNPQQSVFL
ncbi:hypothetical protein SEVIR_2G391900v4 [Setaria viridis]|uniref:Ninja-family protein n=1 Tax=Setaria viridis TaxID=4556 RepID=A0A4V6DBY5_SETVI|nr:ninja-family protein 3-like [Setaria viridis]TKW35694.1 hypothetical protein SEVIR_2G391900v2 [Setaria viridis]TKW35695.1 hypothetical protein SEVIR_2G391900v2 [Setaria viridis]TKW35696.1 hypothetical protein SEVIR_2G391900v2 [Setaria viridis]